MIDTPRSLSGLGLLALLCMGCGPAGARGDGNAAPVRYTVAFPNAVHHEAEVTVVFPGLGAAPLEIRMSRTSPGRYALHEFAKNVYNVRIEGASETQLTATRPDLHRWTVTGHGGQATVRYTLFGDRIDGTYAAIDTEGAMLNIPASMMWAPALGERPIEITFEPPSESPWKVATQLVPTGDPFTYTAPDAAYFLDSPTLLADFALREWTVDSGGTPYTLRFALHHGGSEAEVDPYVDMVKKVVDEEIAIFGELPDFDFGTYTFIAAYLPWAAGDGMEHRNSTVLTRRGSLPGVAMSALGTVAHEFFHAWNMERLRSAAIEPFDFENANVSQELWFGEGFTSYYDDLAMARAEIIDLADFGNRMASLVNTVTNSPGRRFYTPMEMSMQAAFVDAAVSVDPQNRANTFISYYTWGAALGLALDLEIRSRFPGHSLDDYMRAMWAKHGKPFQPYTVDDLEAVLGETLGDAGFAEDFFARFIRGTRLGTETDTFAVEIPAYGALLAQGGLRLRRRFDSPGIAPARLRYEGGRAVVASPVLIGSPLYDAGVEEGDGLVSLNGVDLVGPAALNRALEGSTAGDRVSAVVEVRGGRRTVQVVLALDPTLEVVPFEVSGEPVDEGIRAFRANWLGGG